ncbi:MAG: hypothetical protein ACOC44_09500 [Promethearchaeia archaeon]
MKKIQNQSNGLTVLETLGFALLKIPKDETSIKNFKLIYQKGIGLSMLQNIGELCKDEIITKEKGNSIIPIEDYTFTIHYFKDYKNNTMLTIYMDHKEGQLNYAQVYLLTKKINRFISSEKEDSKIEKFCDERIKIPKTENLEALFIISPNGQPFFVLVGDKNTAMEKSQVNISGFISALFSFSEEIIGEDDGAKLKVIDFGNQRFYIITKKRAIFAFLVKDLNDLLKRYMYLISDEFIQRYKKNLQSFDGNINQFDGFKKVIRKYFKI